MMTKRSTMILTLAAYVLLLFVCAYFYNKEYEKKQSSFVFTSNIIEQTKMQESRQRCEVEITALKEKLDFLEPIYEQVKKQIPDTSISIYSQEVYSYKINDNMFIDFSVFPLPTKHKVHSIDIWNEKGIMVSSLVNYNIESFPYDSLEVISRIIDVNIEDLYSEMNLLEQQKEQANWNFLDFLYFSVITQTTVGYGDILPNSTTIRCIVMIQSILGIILTVFGVTIFFRRKSNINASR